MFFQSTEGIAWRLSQDALPKSKQRKWKAMIRFRIKELLAEKEFREQRKITLGEVSEKTGVNRTSLSKMQSPIMRHSTTTNAIDALCRYFRCQVGDLMVYIDDDQIEAQSDRESE